VTAWDNLLAEYRSEHTGWSKAGEFYCPHCHTSIGKNLHGDQPFSLADKHLRDTHDIGMDLVPRYAPLIVMTAHAGYQHVTGSRAYPPQQHPAKCPLVNDCTAVELVTPNGSRWYGVRSAWINSELRMVVTGFSAKFEEMAKWEVCKQT